MLSSKEEVEEEEKNPTRTRAKIAVVFSSSSLKEKLFLCLLPLSLQICQNS